MAFKPFKPPSVKITNRLDPLDVVQAGSEPLAKRRKISASDCHRDEISQADSSRSNQLSTVRQPLQPLKNTPSPEDSVTNNSKHRTGTYFSALWRRFTQKKNKTWDDDGYISVELGQAVLYDGKGKLLGQTALKTEAIPGASIHFSGRDVELGDRLTYEEFKSATAHTLSDTHAAINAQTEKAYDSDQKHPSAPKPLSLREQMQSQIAQEKNITGRASTNKLQHQTNKRMPFKQPLKETTVLLQTPSEAPIPRHDPHAPGAVVFKRPKKAPAGRQLVDVVLDPMLTKCLREHQKAGVKFLYECVMGLRNFGGEGCILADDMGLGKTLQTIALIWTLLKQNPIHKAEPVIKKALIVCPVSLIQNWKKEFRKWLGRDRLGVLTLEDKGGRLSMFDGKNFKVLIIGYERLRNIAEELTRGAGIDIVVCDEGHRMKTLKNKSAKAIETFNTSKRIILSGTPIQNDLSEFFAMANFVNDGCLGSYKAFVKAFEGPIMKSRQPGATEDDVEKGESASEELAQTTSPFILRRTAEILAKYLPPKTEYVLFCNPTPEQATVYRQVIRSPMFQSALGSHESALQLITILKKLCNSPALMSPDRGNDESTSSSSLEALNEMLPANISRLYHNSFASKIRLLDELLQQIRNTTNDKVILVSNYTSTLNLMANLLDCTGGRYLRLDGSVPQGKRQSLVDEFNNSPSSAYFAFLLSAKAGGVGLNLIGANRLVLFDVDWNPATDDQAMARIHREGQKKHCKIYRFLIKGGLEERIWQRQVVKRGLAESIMEGSSIGGNVVGLGSKAQRGKAAFSREELRDLFRLDESEGLRTHDLIRCGCGGNGLPLASGSNTPAIEDDDDEATEPNDSVVEELPFITDLVKASELTDEIIEDRERRIAAGQHLGQKSLVQRLEKHELMMYSHLDTSLITDMNGVTDLEKLGNVESAIDDSCLLQVLRQNVNVTSGRVAYIFKKSAESGIDSQDDALNVK